jgi:transposase
MEALMSDLFLLSERQMARISPYFPLAHGVPRVDDRRVVSGIVSVIRNGLQWKDASKAYGPHKTLYHYFGTFISGPRVKRARHIGHRRRMACAR